MEGLHPDWLADDVVRHSDECYTVQLLTLDYRYHTYRCHLSLDGRWTVNPLDWSGIVHLTTSDEG